MVIPVVLTTRRRHREGILTTGKARPRHRRLPASQTPIRIILREFRFLQPGGLQAVVTTVTATMTAVLLSIMMNASAAVAHPPLLRACQSNQQCWQHHPHVPTHPYRSKVPQHGNTGSLSDNWPPVPHTRPPRSQKSHATATTTSTSSMMSPGARRPAGRGNRLVLSNSIAMSLNGSAMTLAAPFSLARRYGRNHRSGMRNADKIRLKQCECGMMIIVTAMHRFSRNM